MKTKKQLEYEFDWKIEDMIYKRDKFWKEKLSKRHEKESVYIDSRKKKDIAKRTKAYQDKLAKQLKNLQRLKQNKSIYEYKKKDKTLARYKEHAQIDFQWYIRYTSKDENGFVKTIDGKVRNRKDCDAGHIFSKSKYPHMIFIENNVRPQSKRSNKELGTSDGIMFRDIVIDKIGVDGWNALIKLSENEELKNEIRNKQYRKNKYIYRHNKRLECTKA